MQREIKFILVKFFILTGLLIIYAVLMVTYIVPVAIHNAFGQQFPQDQFNQQQQQFGNNQFDQGQNQFGNNQFGNDQFGSNQYQQSPYQQFGGTQGYNQYPQSYGMYGQPPQYNNNGGFNIQQILGYLLAAGGGTVGGKIAADRKTKALEEAHSALIKDGLEAELKTKQQVAELARVSFSKMSDGGASIQDAPNVKLENLKEDVDQFREKVAKA